MAFNKQLLEIIACPVCKGALIYHEPTHELISVFERLAFPIRENIPVLLESEARVLSQDELDSIKGSR